MPASSHEGNSASAPCSTTGIAAVWLVFYIVILAGSFVSGESRRVPKAYAYSPASQLGANPAPPGTDLANGAMTVPAPNHD